MSKITLFVVIIHILLSHSIFASLPDAIVINDTTNVYADPLMSRKEFTLSKNSVLQIILEQTSPNSPQEIIYKIRSPQGTGWISKNGIALSLSEYAADTDLAPYLQFHEKRSSCYTYDDMIWCAISQQTIYIVYKKGGDHLILTSLQLNKDTLTNITEHDLDKDGVSELILEITFDGKHTANSPLLSWGKNVRIYKFSQSQFVEILNTDLIRFSPTGTLLLCRIILNKTSLKMTTIEAPPSGELSGVILRELRKSEKFFIYTNGKYLPENSTSGLPVLARSIVYGMKLRTEPSGNASFSYRISEDKIVKVLGILDGLSDSMLYDVKGYWLKVEDTKSHTGWIFSYFLDYNDLFLETYLKGTGEKSMKSRINELKLFEIIE